MNFHNELILCAPRLIGLQLSQTQTELILTKISVSYCAVFIIKRSANATMDLHITFYVI